jgi:hypothetical protein
MWLHGVLKRGLACTKGGLMVRGLEGDAVLFRIGEDVRVSVGMQLLDRRSTGCSVSEDERVDILCSSGLGAHTVGAWLAEDGGNMDGDASAAITGGTTEATQLSTGCLAVVKVCDCEAVIALAGA